MSLWEKELGRTCWAATSEIVIGKTVSPLLLRRHGAAPSGWESMHSLDSATGTHCGLVRAAGGVSKKA